jgi:hypothetical protein
MKLSASQIAQLAAGAGFAGSDLVTAVAVALAESLGGDPNAYNPELQAKTPEGKGSYGLWQIYLKAHPEFADWDLYDPETNAAAAFLVYRGAGRRFTPWTTFKTGAYRAHLAAASAAIGGNLPGPTAPVP